VVLARQGIPADPQGTGTLLAESADALLDGGTAPSVEGDDDATTIAAAKGTILRGQLRQAQRLVHDLTATGNALLEGRPVTAVPLTANEHIAVTDPVLRLRVLAGLTSNVSLNAVRTVANTTDRNITDLIALQIGLGVAGLLTSLLLAWGLIWTTRRQTAHFRSLITSSTDLVVVFGAGRCRYVSPSISSVLGHAEHDLLDDGFARLVHPEDAPVVYAACVNGKPREIVFRMTNHFGEPRHLEAHVTDLRDDRHVRGVVLNARDVSERVQLEEELKRRAFHDSLTDLPNRALFRDRLDQALARSRRSREVLSVLLVDLDGFKIGRASCRERV